jgi:BirA family transcriptional regulator, biotin operon repressor / biotin---[acetyl-CoA-carboxylase] ligase
MVALGVSAHRLEGLDERELAAVLGVPRVALFERVGSTMDEALLLAESGVAAGAIVIADEQVAGRGRGGRRWRSQSALGLWMTLIERPDSVSGLDVLSLRIGLGVAPVLERLGGRAVRLKWPNDLYVGPHKLSGVLIEARWREQRPDWVAIGIGVNIVAPSDLPGATGLGSSVTRRELLDVLVPALRAAAARRGPLSEDELAEFERRDFARDRRCAAPVAGIAKGITRDGELIVETERGIAHYRGGSLELAVEAQ